ncbi:NCS1 family nucleobase:cation symporter-1 [Streptomyces sp. 840.1]|uniref:purine-cytosine permease family protein n=1 Tax=Streptomyces sp. 840.1 TaxID=2485152 RepID=UPI000FBAD5BA|nr:cytosine permease [Streptomyces sp. 840.1]ROQ67173.1 NCS1 family nucleobase:cation symporter-1 [Streptomyces sp. 840.1]
MTQPQTQPESQTHPPTSPRTHTGRLVRVLRNATAVETSGIEPIAADARSGGPGSSFTLWFSSNVQFSSLSSGMLATAAFGLGWVQALLAIMLGSAVGAAAIGAMSTFGPRSGVGLLVQTKGPLGRIGAAVPAVLVFFKACAWFAVNSVLGAFAVQTLLGTGFGPAFAIVTVSQVAIALVGYGFIHLVQKTMAVVLPLLFIVVSGYALTKSDLGSAFDADRAGALGFAGAFALTIAVQAAQALSFSSYAADYTRYMPVDTSPRRLFTYAFTGTWLGSVWIAGLGAAIGTIAFIGTPTDLVGQVLPGLFATVTMLALGISTITSSCLDCYSGALAWLIAGVRMRRWQAVLVVGVLGGTLGWLAGQGDYWKSFENFLILLGNWIAPWLAVMLVDRYLARRPAGAAAPAEPAARFGPGFASWLLGLAAAVPFMSQPGILVGPVAKAHPPLGAAAAAVAFLTAGLIHYLLTRRPGGRAVPTGRTTSRTTTEEITA